MQRYPKFSSHTNGPWAHNENCLSSSVRQLLLLQCCCTVACFECCLHLGWRALSQPHSFRCSLEGFRALKPWRLSLSVLAFLLASFCQASSQLGASSLRGSVRACQRLRAQVCYFVTQGYSQTVQVYTHLERGSLESLTVSLFWRAHHDSSVLMHNMRLRVEGSNDFSQQASMLGP